MVPSIIMISVFVVILLLVVLGGLSRYKQCPPNKILVVSGKTGEGASKCIHGGAEFVWPILQTYDYLDLAPMVLDVNLRGALSQENIRINVPSTVTVAISKEANIMRNASVRLLGMDKRQIIDQAGDIVYGQMRAVVATMSIEQLNRDRQAFLESVDDAITKELEKIGMDLININISDITDESGYIEAQGKKASAEAINQAHIDVAEQEKLGEIGVAKRTAERESEVAKLKKEAELNVARADQEKAIELADIKAIQEEKETESKKRISDASRDLSVKNTQNIALSEVADAEARAKINVASQHAEEQEQTAKQKAERSRYDAEVVIPAEAKKRVAIIEAEAEAESVKAKAQAQADAIFVKMKAEGDGGKAIIDGKAEGYERLVKACAEHPELAVSLLITEQMPELGKLMAKAMENLQIDKLAVFDGGSGNGLSGLGSNFVDGLPRMHQFADAMGVSLPHYYGSQKNGKTEAELPKPLAVADDD